MVGCLALGLMLWPVSAAAESAGPSSSAPSSCSPTFGIRQLHHLFTAFNSGDQHGVRAVLRRARPHRDGLEVTPTLARFAHGHGRNDSSDIHVHRRRDLVAFMRDIHGYRFELLEAGAGSGTNLQSGPDAWTGPAVAIALKWRASRSSRGVSAQHQILGAGKALVMCPSGKFARALFAPSGLA